MPPVELPELELEPELELLDASVVELGSVVVSAGSPVGEPVVPSPVSSLAPEVGALVLELPAPVADAVAMVGSAVESAVESAVDPELPTPTLLPSSVSSSPVKPAHAVRRSARPSEAPVRIQGF